MKKKAIVVGSGAGGATIARELQGDYDVTVLEAGGTFRPFGMGLDQLERLRRLGLFLDERQVPLAMPSYRIRRAADGMVLVNGAGLGGTTTICTGNALRMDHDLRALGIDLDDEFAEIDQEIPITSAHQRGWRPVTRQLFSAFEELGLKPQPTPKMGHYERCSHCGRCQLGCPDGIKWDSRRSLRVAQENGAQVLSGCRVKRVQIEYSGACQARATGVWASAMHFFPATVRFFPADLVVLAAGGFETPAILDRSGIACEPRLFVDPVLCVAARAPGSRLDHEVAMPFVSSQEHFILSPYFDHLSFLFNPQWRLPAGDIVSIMIKLADDGAGRVSRRGVQMSLTPQDRSRLAAGAALAREVLHQAGLRPEDTFLGTVIAGHPGGTLPLTQQDAESLHPNRLPANLFVADASLLPHALGNPPILTIIALAKRIARVCAGL